MHVPTKLNLVQIPTDGLSEFFSIADWFVSVARWGAAPTRRIFNFRSVAAHRIAATIVGCRFCLAGIGNSQTIATGKVLHSRVACCCGPMLKTLTQLTKQLNYRGADSIFSLADRAEDEIYAGKVAKIDRAHCTADRGRWCLL
jgi:hypothetical protein